MTSFQVADGRPRQRRRLLSSSEVEEMTAQRRSDLLAAARSHGPHTWSNADVRNALLWFRQQQHPASSLPPAAAANNAEGTANTSLAIKGADKDAFELLRSLLHNPGIAEARPAIPRRAAAADDDSLGDEYRIRKEPRRSEAPIREVLVGYASVESNNDAVSVSAMESSGGRCRRPLDAMRSDLADIAKARSETHGLYNACLVSSSGGGKSTTPGCDDKDADANGSNSDVQPLSRLVGLGGDDLCLAVLDESDTYFRRPSTAVATAYASEIYDRLVDLEGGTGSTGSGGGGTKDAAIPTSSLTNASKQLLDKLGMLALSNMRIVEVYGLLLLEPIRRLRLSKVRQDQTTSSAAHDSKSGAVISSLDIDKACSTVLCTELCQHFINIRQHDKKKGKQSNRPCSFVWADLPSPLLCAISHAYFPFAREYVQNLLQRAIDIHIGMPRILADRVIRNITSSSGVNENMGEQDGSTVGMSEDIIRDRIIALVGTSDRLASLVKNELNRAEDIDSDSTCTGNDEHTGTGDDMLANEKRKDILCTIRKALSL